MATNVDICTDSDLIRSNGTPFEIRLSVPNSETIAAIKDVDLNHNMSRPFRNVKELIEDLDADD